jgi:Kdo2-lipid IVA lauroyltransferase/acyltransferase
MSFLIKAIFTPLSWFYSNLPRGVQILCADILGVIWFDVFRIRRKVILENLTLAFPDWEKKKKVSVGRKSVQSLCLAFCEYLILIQFEENQLQDYFEIENKNRIDEQLQSGKGALLMSLHLGTIDLALAAVNYFGYKVNATQKKIKTECIEQFIGQLRSKHGIKSIADRRNPFDIFRALKNNEALFFVMDQFMGRPHGIPVKFFGHTAWTAAGLAAFALKTKMAVIPIYNFRRDDGKIVIKTLEPIELEVQEDREQTISVMTQKYNDALEKIVRMYPEQWLWMHRRWKS